MGVEQSDEIIDQLLFTKVVDVMVKMIADTTKGS